MIPLQSKLLIFLYSGKVACGIAGKILLCMGLISTFCYIPPPSPHRLHTCREQSERPYCRPLNPQEFPLRIGVGGEVGHGAGPADLAALHDRRLVGYLLGQAEVLF